MTAIRRTRRTGAWRVGWPAAAVFLVATSACDGTPTAPDGNVPIISNYGTKIVYGTSRTLDVPALRQHCQNLNGTFNECGTVCAPRAAGCVTVCAYTCEGIPR